MFKKILIANRGEIALRVICACKELGIKTVAVYSEADRNSLHVRFADEAICIGPPRSSESYLNIPAVISAAEICNVDGIHPGYGLLSENANFAEVCETSHVKFIGPSPEVIRLMGEKEKARMAMKKSGVPILPGSEGVIQNVDEAIEWARQIGYPVIVKASAGGGGRGMRIVRTLAGLPEAVASASREAAAAFGDPTVFCERFLDAGHHVEVQILADAHGTVWALGERECSLQRRHQKVIEEAPAPLVDRLGGDLRERLLTAGRDAAAAVGYRGAGTVEFLADERGDFWFLEMNTRLQVEHPVTECVTGTDLVGLQLDIAAGLPLSGPAPAMTGHAIEARLYAESPADDWRPETGTVVTFDVPAVSAHFDRPATDGIRLDSGVEAGSVVGTHYDGMLAKVISYAATREAAARQLAAALRRARVHGLPTNRDLLVASLLHPTFLDGTADTAFYTDHPPAALLAGTGLDPALGALVAALSDAALVPGLARGFRNIPVGYRSRTYALGDRSFEVRYRFGRDGLEVAGMEAVTQVEATASAVVLDLDGVRRRWTVGRFDDRVVVDGPQGSVTLRRVPRFTDPSAQLPPGALVAPIPGTVVRVDVAVGDPVVAGQPLVWLEAMKMEHVVRAPADGTVSSLPVPIGEQVSQGTPLAVVAP
jgi:acyl-CoA carboxylase subunit alpha